MKMAWRTDTGRVRKHNEDSIGLFRTKKGALVAVVADGMGGHQAGDVASRHAVEIIRRELDTLSSRADVEERRQRLLEAVQKANQSVFQLANEVQKYKGMGTTLIAAVIAKREIVLAHIGDSRAYLLHRGGLYQLTEDHSLVNILKKHGQITEEEARNHPQRNVIIRSLGTNEEVEADIIETPWNPGDTLLMCTDGLTGMVDVRQIGLVLTSRMTLDQQADRLVQLANEAGGTDNISLILLKNTRARKTYSG
ncbi:Stp1/IreP family PP2C-type Ser/Thr phosphatase [Polycladomyces sp. WAk]|jgi:serine/threonine protein phosphatase PrpC|uniref:protein-serine/threonine phosphatase n=2 Tax=Polycladomyces TaxID=1348505 RepID=A0A8D5ZMY8_9BACL|nr:MULTISPECIES: Stp1/IreP family PP2C-type Ser/Thr phosphatase [Polycladomyces]MBN2908296.1 Stp1/IreP family PP2C-type Ser/Thr phosphatase [Polycladomyces sp. WAk]BCU82185.1 serine/threonine phosphatase stp [Polycladomyces abyssicola]